MGPCKRAFREAARRAGMRALVLTTTLPAAFAEFDNVIRLASDFRDPPVDALLAA